MIQNGTINLLYIINNISNKWHNRLTIEYKILTNAEVFKFYFIFEH